MGNNLFLATSLFKPFTFLFKFHLNTEIVTKVFTRENWEQLREDRFQKAKKVGLISEDLSLSRSQRNSDLGPSNESEKYYYEQAMMANAGMLESMNANIELISYLRETGQFDNTIFVVTSDNGPEFNHPTSSALFNAWRLANGYHDDPERAGEFRSVTSIGPEWALAAATPGNCLKFYLAKDHKIAPNRFGDGFLQEGFNRVTVCKRHYAINFRNGKCTKRCSNGWCRDDGQVLCSCPRWRIRRIYEPDGPPL